MQEAVKSLQAGGLLPTNSQLCRMINVELKHDLIFSTSMHFYEIGAQIFK